MNARKSIARRLVLLIGLGSALIFLAVLGFSYQSSRHALESELEENARNLAASLTGKVELELLSVQRVSEGVARALENNRWSEAELLSLMRETLGDNPSIYGTAVAFEPNRFRTGLQEFAPYVYRKGSGLDTIRLDTAYHHVPYRYQDWYQIPRELGRTQWSEPYFDDGGGNMAMTTCSVPFYGKGSDGSSELLGVVTADINLQALTRIVTSVPVMNSGYAALVSQSTLLLSHPDTSLVMKESLFSLAESRNNPQLRDLGRRMVRGESGFVRYTNLKGEPGWMYFAPVSSTGWSIIAIFPQSELLEDVQRLTITMAVIGTLGVLFLLGIVSLVSRSITKPLTGLAEAAGAVASGDFDVALPPITRDDEVGALTGAFRSMQRSLKDYIRELTETTAARERIQSELKVATDIQASLLPRIFPAFPDRPEFDIYASMDPAKEVGGDFYDFFFVDHDRLCFLIADVADKGVPAALYMMVAKTLLKSQGQRLREPSRVLRQVNDILAEDNERSMFATVFCAILDTRTGEVEFSNAGHNPPVLMARDGVRMLEPDPGFLLGPIAGMEFTTERFSLAPGETLFLYTDGVTEAKDPSEALYGEERLLEAIREHALDGVETLIHQLRKEVEAFAAGAPQSDDITMIAVRYRGPGPVSVA